MKKTVERLRAIYEDGTVSGDAGWYIRITGEDGSEVDEILSRDYPAPPQTWGARLSGRTLARLRQAAREAARWNGYRGRVR
jgi:hypothetical protein